MSPQPESARYTTPDVIVVGAGSAGSVVVRRLLDSGLRVTVLEAGPADDTEAIHDPQGSAALWNSPYDWGYQTEPQSYAQGNRLLQPRGRTLGGSSAFNGMIYVRGLPADYDLWSQLGAFGWEWSAVEPYFRKLEDFDGGPEGGRGVGGPMHVQRHPSPDALVRAWVAAAQQAGHPFNDDYNSGSSDGVSYTQHTIRDGRRATSWVEYVRPVAQHPNLTVLTDATVARLVVEGDRVVGVEYLHGEALHALHAEETVLAAGVFGTPQILLLSGIGSADQLRRFGLPVHVDLPGVGQNLQDHVSSPFVWESNGPIPAPTAQRLEAHVFVRTRPGLITPDVQPIMMSYVYRFISGPLPEHGFSTVGQVLHPLSRGEVTLRSTKPRDAPLINPRVFAEPYDLDVLVDNMLMIREIGRQPALEPFVKREAYPGPTVTTSDEMRAHVRSITVSSHHQVGTARMGVDSSAVTDPELRVHGLRGLRIADASVMPTLPTGNTNAAALMIGERAADFILGKAAAR